MSYGLFRIADQLQIAATAIHEYIGRNSGDERLIAVEGKNTRRAGGKYIIQSSRHNGDNGEPRQIYILQFSIA